MTGAAAGVLVFTSTDVGTTQTGRFFVKHFRVVGSATTAAGDKCIVKNANGDVLFATEADGARFIDVHPLYKFTNGIAIDSLAANMSLYVYLA